MMSYNIGGLYFTSVMNLTIDSMMVGLMAIANAQIKILGVRVAQLGHNPGQNHYEIYNELRKCIIFHNHNLRYY